MKLTTPSNVPVYTISGSNTSRPLPDWLARKRKRSLKNDPEYANRIELLQDFEFEEASSCIRISEDGDWVMSTGTYKPQIHVHSLPQLSLSFARHTNTLNKTFFLLSSDYSKSLHLQSDRSLEFHTPSGCHYTTRIPRYGRDLAYDRRSAEALIPSVGTSRDTGKGEVFRLNLELGRFMKSYDVDVGGSDSHVEGGNHALQGGIDAGSVNTASIAESSHNLCAFGTSLGTVEFYDARARRRVALLPSPPSSSAAYAPPDPSDPFATANRTEITALTFAPNGLTFASGTSAGLTYLYDLRSPRPFLKKDQGYGYPIHTLQFLPAPLTSSAHSTPFTDPLILSSDKRIIKLWSSVTAEPFTAVEPAVDLNSIALYPDSGLILTANEGRAQHSFFIPSLGPAPRWCSFLDHLVEEMAEDAADPSVFHPSSTHRSGEVYDNYKFLTVPQLRAVNLEHLIGTTSLLRPYMHGYFVDQQLYEEARVISNPDAWAEQRRKSVRERIEKERESRIRGHKSRSKLQPEKFKVNKELAQRTLEREERHRKRKVERLLRNKEREGKEDEEDEQPAENRDDKKESGKTPALLTDPRFASLFTNEEFAVDETSNEFKALNASTKLAGEKKQWHKEQERLANETNESGGGNKLTAAELEELRTGSGGESSSSSDEGENEEDSEQSGRGGQNRRDGLQNRSQPQRDRRRNPHEQARKPRMHVSSSGHKPSDTRKASQNMSFGARVKEADHGGSFNLRARKSTFGGSKKGEDVRGDKEVTFTVGGGERNKQQGGWHGGNQTRGGGKREWKGRRSASGNTFRRM